MFGWSGQWCLPAKSDDWLNRQKILNNGFIPDLILIKFILCKNNLQNEIIVNYV